MSKELEVVAWVNRDPQGGLLFFRNPPHTLDGQPLYGPEAMERIKELEGQIKEALDVLKSEHAAPSVDDVIGILEEK